MRFSCKTGVALILGWFLAFPVPGFSKTAEEQPEAYTLGEVVVTGEREGVEAVGTVREITAEDIQRNGARTLDEALDLLPGIQVRTGNDGVPRVDMRGFRSRHVLLLLDGIPFNSTSDGQFDPTMIPTENIARIKISYGNHSVLYGEGGLGGVINIITKKGTEGIQGKVSGEASERNKWLGRFNLSGAKDSVDFFLGGSLMESDGYRLSDDFEETPYEDGGLRENSDRKYGNLFANLGYKATDSLSLGLVYNYLKGEYGKPPSTIDKAMDPVFAKNLKYERVDDVEGNSGQVSFNWDNGSPLSLRGWAYANQQDEETNRYDDDRYNSQKAKGAFHEEARTTISGANLQSGWDMGSAGRLTMGLSLAGQEFESSGYEILDKKGTKGVLALDKELDTYSLALEYEVNPLDSLGITIGYGHHWLNKEEGNDDDDGSFLIGAYYDLLKDTRLRASVARKIRFPSIKQLYDAPNGGNIDLTTERSMNYELGIEQNLPMNSRLTLTGFWIDVDDYIEKNIYASDLYENYEEYRFKGFELTAETRFIENLMLRAGYTYMETEDRSEGTLKDELQYRPEHKISLEAGYDFDFGLSVYAALLYVTDQYFYSEEATVTPPDNKKALNDYTVVNLRLNQKLSSSGVSLYAGADNLFDEDYEESYGSPREGRTMYAGIEFEF